MKRKEKDAKRTLFCNFTLEVIGVDIVYINGSEKYSQYIQVRIAFRENVNKGQNIYNIPIDKIDKMHWKELNVHCRYNPEIPESKVERYLNDHIRAQIGKAPRRVVESLNSAGMYKIDGQPIFYTGKVVIQSPAKKTTHVIKTELSKENLDINNELSESDAARILPVKMVKPDGKKLQYFQEHPVNISTFYYYYISWFIEHYDEACKILKEIWNKYEDADLGVHDRLREMHFFLSTAYFLFLQYRYNKGFLKDADAIMCYKSFNAMLTKLIRQQNERVQSGIPKQFANVDYLRAIRELYISKQFHTAYNIAAFDETHHDSVIWKECLWFRGECLNRFFPDINPTEIISELEQKNILQVGKDKKTKQLHLLKGKRFYVIPLRYLT